MTLQFIEPELGKVDVSKAQPASYIRNVFEIDYVPKKAELSLSALGVYKAWLNGRELDSQMLLPGYTNYHARVQLQAYEVAEKLVKGKNVLAVILGDGWYRGSAGVSSVRGFYGDKIKFAARMEDRETEKVLLETDESWKATQDGPIRANDNKVCEIVDMTKEMPGWLETEFDDSSWHDCVKGSYTGECVLSEGEPILEQERFTPVVLHTPDHKTVLDFGQNLAGHVEFTVTGKAGQTVTLRMGEVLDEKGNFTQKNVGGDGNGGALTGTLGQCLQYTLKDGRQTYKSQFLISGYRYVLLEGWPEEVKPENFVSIAIYSVLQETGSFSCSNDKINQLMKNSRWSQKSNFVDVPTDCPTRERAGWTGDINVFCETACYYTDVRKFLYKYLKDMLTLQREDGNLPFIVPEVPLELSNGRDVRALPYGSAGWSDALIHIPMVLYRFYGDTEAITLVYEAAKRFIGFEMKRARKRHWTHLHKRGEHFQYILDTGFHFGEWLEPGHDMGRDLVHNLFFTDYEVATAWFYQSVREVAIMAGILNRPDDKERYTRLADEIRRAYRREFLKDGTVRSKRQCRYVRPVDMGLVTKEEAGNIVAKLNEMLAAGDYKVGTGFLTTYRVMHVLSEYGYVDTAYRLLLNENCPGWMYEINKGATTTWENWIGVDGNNVPRDSMNHYAPGANLGWMYSHCCGIRPLKPGFRKILIAPMPGGGLTWAKASYESIRGRIVSEWKIEDGLFLLHVEVPQGTETRVVLPDGSEKRMSGGVGEYQVRI